MKETVCESLIRPFYLRLWSLSMNLVVLQTMKNSLLWVLPLFRFLEELLELKLTIRTILLLIYLLKIYFYALLFLIQLLALHLNFSALNLKWSTEIKRLVYIHWHLYNSLSAQKFITSSTFLSPIYFSYSFSFFSFLQMPFLVKFSLSLLLCLSKYLLASLIYKGLVTHVS